MENRDFLHLADGRIVKFQVYLEKFVNKSKYIPLPRNQYLKKILKFIYFKFTRKIQLFCFLLFRVQFTLNSPEKKNNIIIDGSMHHFTKFLVKKNNFYILETRINLIKKIYLTREVIFYLIKNFNKNSLKINYLVILIKIIKPKNVITLIDNSFDFFSISRILSNEKINFYALQNGTRRNESKLVIKKRYIPNYYTFSKYEKKLFKKSIHVKNFFPIGSIKAEIAKKYFLNKRFKKNVYDICLISEPEIFINEYSQAKHIDKDLSLIFKYCINFSKKFNKKIIIIGKSNLDDVESKIYETEFYKNFLSQIKFKIFFHNKKKFEGYKKIFQSKVIVGATSSLLREAFAFDKKVLCCKYIKDKYGNLFPSSGLPVLKKKNYAEFEKRLNEILGISYSKYLKKIRKIDDIYTKKKNIVKIIQKKFN